MTPPSAESSDHTAEELLLQRARLLASPPGEGRAEELLALVCRVRAELYAIALGSCLAVLPADGLVAVPCTPPHVAGVLNVRGDIVTVLDLAGALGFGSGPSTDEGSGARMVLVEHQRGRLGLLVDEVREIRGVSLEHLDRPLSDRSFVRGIADREIVLLDLARLLAEQQLEVNEQPI